MRRCVVLALLACLVPVRAGAQSIAQFTFPADQATAVDASHVASWTTVSGADVYYLYVGTTVGANDIVNSGETTATNWPMCDVPVNQVVYGRIWTKIAGVWSYSDITFTATSSPQCRAALSTPADGSSNASLTNGFAWGAVPNAQSYTLWIGTSAGASNVLNTGGTTSTSRDSCDIPTNQLLYARMWTQVGVWRFVDSSFTASDAAVCHATLTYPATSGATHVDTSQPLAWTGVPNEQAYYLYVGTAVGLKDLVNTGEIQATSYLASTLPQAQTVYVRLWTKLAGVWRYADSTFRAGNSAPTINTISSQQTSIGASYTLTIPANDADQDALTYAASNLPAGLSVNSASGVISGTPTTAGPRTITVNASDGHGGSTSAAFSMHVIDTSDTTAPTITAVVTPAGQASVWRNSATTVTFICNDSGAGIASCSSPVTLTGSGANQQVSGTAIDNSDNQTTVTASVNIDLAAPTVTIQSPQEGTDVSADSIVLSGTLADDLSGLGTTTCNGVPVVPANGSATCTIPLQKGLNTVILQATDMAGNSASASVHVVRSGAASMLQISPYTPTLLAGETLALSVLDDFGRAPSPTTWSSDAPSVVAVDASGILHAVSAGTASVSASANSLTATMTVTVNDSSAVLANGTFRWHIADPAPAVTRGATAVQRTDGTMFVNADGELMDGSDGFVGDNNIRLRGYGLDGRQTSQFSAGLAFGETVRHTMSAGDGGTLLVVERQPTNQADFSAWKTYGPGDAVFLTHVDATGRNWRTLLGYTGTWSVDTRVSQSSDGTVFTRAFDEAGVVALDGATGQNKFIIPAPFGQYYRRRDYGIHVVIDGGNQYSQTVECPQLDQNWAPLRATIAGGRVDAGGRAAFIVTTSNVSENHFYNTECSMTNWATQWTNVVADHTDVSLLRIDSAGFVDVIPIDIEDKPTSNPAVNDLNMGGIDVLPDDTGGVLATWQVCNPTCRTLARYVGPDDTLAGSYQIADVPSLSGANYLGYSNSGVFDMRDGSALWSNASLNPVAVLDDGTVITQSQNITGPSGTVSTGAALPLVANGSTWIYSSGAVIEPTAYVERYGFASLSGSELNSSAAGLSGTGLFVKGHVVADNDFHTTVWLVPADQERWRTLHVGDPICAPTVSCFVNQSPPAGVQIAAGAYHATVGGGPTGLVDLGTLNTGIDRDRDISGTAADFHVLSYSRALENVIIARLFEMRANYEARGEVPYALWPEPTDPYYNSNSLVSGMLRALPTIAGAYVVVPSWPANGGLAYPGWTKPLPVQSFAPVAP